MSEQDAIQRTILPIPDRGYVGLTTYDAKDPDTKFPPIEPLRPPKGAPNVLIVLLDDVGFAASSAFGWVISTPTAERLAESGLKFNRFHTTALCSPTRQALLTGRNHHSVNMGGICEIATSAPGYTSILPKSKAPLPMTLKLNGYSTAQFGKCHEVPVWETSPMGPFDQWPSGGGGFEYFYGFLGGETNQFYPAIYEGTTPIEPDKTPQEGYHFTEDMTNKAIKWVRQQKALMPDKPFFMYYAPGACHAPHHVPKEWGDKYKGKFDQGWDKLREEIFLRQKELQVIPGNAELTKRPEEVPAWDGMPAELKPILARQMEIYAAFLDHTDHHIGRLVDALKELEVLDDTLVLYIIGDNGASAEGTLTGSFNELAMLNGMAAIETVEFMKSRIDEFGGPHAYNHYAVGWAHAMDTPTNGPSKSRRIGAARATARSCTGPTASKPREKSVRNSLTSSMSPRRSLKRQVCPIRRLSIACSRPPWRASACSMPSTPARRLIDTRPSISRCFATGASTTRAGLP